MVYSGTFLDVGPTQHFDQEKASELVREMRNARFGLGFLYLGVITTSAGIVWHTPSLPAWSLGVAPTACLADWYLLRPWMEHLMFIRAWLDFVTWSVHDPFDYSHGNVWEVAWTNAVEELREYMRPWTQAAPPYSSLRADDWLSIERGVALLARLYGYRPRSPEWEEWLTRRNSVGVDEYPLHPTVKPGE